MDDPGSRVGFESVTIRHQLGKFLYRRPLMGRNWDGVNPQSGRDLGMPKLRLGILGRASGQLQQRGMGASEGMPAHPRYANLLSGGFQMAENGRRVNALVPLSPEPFLPESCQAPVLHAGKDR